MGSQFNIREMPERSLQQLEDLQFWCGYTKTQLVLLAIDRLWLDTRNDREGRAETPKAYIEIRLRKDQLNLQDIICDMCEKSGKTWGFPTPREPGMFTMSLPDDMDTQFLDGLGVEYRLVQYH